MTIARIFAPLTGTDDTWAVANVACDLASRFHAHVTAQYVKLNPTPYDYFAPLDSSATLPYAAILSAAETNEERAQIAHAAFETARKKFILRADDGMNGTGATWGGALSGPAALGLAGRLSDLIVVAQPRSSKTEGQMATFDAALFRARRSVLMAHDGATGLAPKSIAVAYNGSAEAARALTCALPFLREAERTNIVTSGPLLEGAPSVQDVINYLAAHGVTAIHRPAVEVSGTVGNTLLAIAHVFEADLIVMGAYTHSHLREMVLGGVTRFMLEQSDVSILMAH